MARQSHALQVGFDSEQANSDRLAELVRDNLVFVWRSLRRMGLSVAEADDVTQHVFLLAARRLDAISPGRERAFLFASALRLAASTRRKLERRREILSSDVVEMLADPTPNPEQLVEQRGARELLDSVLGHMPVDLRAVFILYEVEQLTVPEIAQVLELKAGTVASRLRRARADFQERVLRIEAKARSRGEVP